LAENKSPYKTVRCPNCGKKLAEVRGDAEIKCTRAGCKAIVYFHYDEDETKHVIEKPRSESSGKRFY
jgi:phage FluMu protein Com